jgi:very-short-patch-repair endonuclease
VGADARTVTFARKLRKEMSLPEVLLWRELRGKPLGIKFRRQYPVKGFVADFACLESRLLIEIDGIAHDMGERPQRDERRDAILKADGWRVVRIAAKRVLAEPLETAEAIVRLARSLQEAGSSPERGGGSPQG